MITTVAVKDARRRRAVRGRHSGDEVARLVKSAAGGDQYAWNALVEEFGGLVWAVARAYRLNDADAADVAQEAWLRVLEHIKQLKDPARLGAWLATTTRRECLRVLRAGGRQLPFGDDTPEPESSAVSPGEALLVAERDQVLWGHFARLRASDQALLRLLVADPPRPYEEISAALDIPVGSIGPTRARALERLRRELECEESLSLLLPS